MTRRHCFGKLAQCHKYTTDHNYNIVEVIFDLVPICNITISRYSVNNNNNPLQESNENNGKQLKTCC